MQRVKREFIKRQTFPNVHLTFDEHLGAMCLPTQAQAVDVVIVGGGLCGVLAAHRCHTTDLTYCLIERQSDLGGVWASLANQHSQLQVMEERHISS